jgi:hypothetical protein
MPADVDKNLEDFHALHSTPAVDDSQHVRILHAKVHHRPYEARQAG